MLPVQAKAFYFLLLATVLGALAAAALVNLRVDPYNMYTAPQRSSQQMSRLEQFPHMRLAKPWTMRRLAPEALILGSSRSGKLPPTTRAWQGLVAYNAAVPGMTSREMLGFLQHGLAQGRLTRLTLGLDFASAIDRQPQTRPGFVAARMMAPPGTPRPWAYQRQRLADLTVSLFTLSALGDSLSALAGVNPVYREYAGDGSWRNRESPLVGEAGYRFVGRNHVAMEKARQPGLDQHLAVLSEVIGLAYAEGLDTRILVTPVHGFMLLLWDELGRTDEWWRFHRELVQANLALAAQHGREPFPLFGFNAEAGVVTEAIPRRRDFGGHWFLDGVHSAAPLGERMMRAAWGKASGFGVRLSPANLESYLVQSQALAAGFAASNRDQAQRLMLSIKE